MLQLKRDKQIHIKNEKEVFRLARLLVFTFILSATMYGLPDYIWNVIWYRIAVYTVPWIVTIPAIINCVERKVNIREMLGNHILFQILIGTLIGTILAGLWTIGYYMIYKSESGYYAGTWKATIMMLLQFLFIVAPTEELIYRVGIMGQLQSLIEKRKWMAPLLANILFALSHLFQHGWDNVLLAFGVGAVYSFLFYKWKRCGFIMVCVMHGMFDFMTCMIPAWIAF